jgi:6-phosphogluconolactonase
MMRSFKDQMRPRTLLASYALLLLLALTGCNGFFTSEGGATQTTGFVYVLNQNPGGIGSVSGFSAAPTTGVLTQLLNSPFGAGNQLSSPNSMSVDASGKFLYVSNTGGGGIVGFAISQSALTLGQLSSIATTATTANPAAIVVDGSLRAVYAVEPGPQVEAFTINSSTGALTAQTGSPYSLGASAAAPTSVAEAANGAFLFVGMNDGSILSVPINSNGTVNVSAGAVITTLPLAGVSKVASLAADTAVRFLYAVDGIQNISAYTITSGTGKLTAVSNTPFTGGGSALSPVSVGVDTLNANTFVFAANKDSNNVSAFNVGGNGALTSVTGSPFPETSATAPFALAVDPSGNFVYVANNTSPGNVASFVVLGNGALSAASTPNASTGSNPVAVVAIPALQ